MSVITTDITKAIGMYQAGASSGSAPGGAGTPPQQNAYPNLFSPWLNNPVRWGLNYLSGPAPTYNGAGAQTDWSSMLNIGPYSGTNYWFMQHGGKVNYSIGMLPGWAGGTPYAIHLVNDGAQLATLARGATGEWDQHWKDFAVALAGQHTVVGNYYNMQEIWINLGWECNERTKFWPWGFSTAQEAADYAAYFRKIVTAMRTAVPGRFKFVYNVNAGAGPLYDDLAVQGYPGDTYVNAMGMEMYDDGGSTPIGGRLSNGNYATPQAVWDDAFTAPRGYKWMHDFVEAHNLAYAVPEWGLVPNPVQSANRTDSNGNPLPPLTGGGDNPTFITNFANYCKTFSRLAYVNCFNIYSGDGIDHQLDSYPNAKVAFRAAFS